MLREKRPTALEMAAHWMDRDPQLTSHVAETHAELPTSKFQFAKLTYGHAVRLPFIRLAIPPLRRYRCHVPGAKQLDFAPWLSSP
jgi:hypothetical protein